MKRITIRPVAMRIPPGWVWTVLSPLALLLCAMQGPETQPPRTQLALQLIAKLKAATVYIEATYPTVPGITSTGSGFFIADDGLILTNRHVVDGLVDIDDDGADEGPYPVELSVVLASGTSAAVTHPAQIVALGGDEADLALIRVNEVSATDFLRVESTADLMETQSIWAVGFPLGIPEISIREGTISRFVHDDAGRTEFIEHTATLSEGNSGGPLVTDSGRVVGVNTLVLGQWSNTNLAIAGDTAQAFITANTQGEVNPLTQAELHRMSAQAWLDQGRYEEAVEEYRAALQHDPVNPELLVALAQAYYYWGDYPQACRISEQAVTLDPQNPVWHNELGVFYYYADQDTAAIAEYQAAIRLDPEYATPYHNLAIVYEMQGEIDEAIEQYNRALALDPLCSLYHYDLGDLYYNQQRYDEAIIELTKAVEYEPQKAAYQNHLGNSYYALERYGPAIGCYHLAIEFDPQNPVYQFNLGNVYFDQELFLDAIPLYERAFELNPLDPDFHLALGTCYYVTERVEDALVMFAYTLLVVEPSDDYFTTALELLAQVADAAQIAAAAENRASQQHWEEAAALFLAAFTVDPTNLDAAERAGSLLVRSGWFNQALVVLEQVTAARPDNGEAWNNLGLALDELERNAEAVPAYQRSLALNPQSHIAHYNLGTVLEELERLPEAEAEYLASILADPSDPDTYTRLGGLYLKQGKTTEARSQLEQALRLSEPGQWAYDTAQELLDSL